VSQRAQAAGIPHEEPRRIVGINLNLSVSNSSPNRWSQATVRSRINRVLRARGHECAALEELGVDPAAMERVRDPVANSGPGSYQSSPVAHG
jgi:hypothetical protein